MADKFKVGDVVVCTMEHTGDTSYSKIGYIGIVSQCDGDGVPQIDLTVYQKESSLRINKPFINDSYYEKIDWLDDSQLKENK